MTPCPEIATFEIRAGPCGEQWCARFVEPTKPGNTVGKRAAFLPIFFDGLTEAAVRDAAATFWRDEQDKIEARKARARAMIAARIAGRTSNPRSGARTFNG